MSVQEVRTSEADTACMLHWIGDEAARRAVQLTFHGSRDEGSFRSVFVHVANPGWDAVAKARALQEIEDAWNYPSAGEAPGLGLLLVPTAG